MSVERVGGVEPETVEGEHPNILRARTVFCNECYAKPGEKCCNEYENPLPQVHWSRALSADLADEREKLRLVEEELRQAREVAHSRLRDRARLVRRAERAEADLDLLIRRFALVSARSGMRAQALQLAEECITENVANGEGVDSQPAALDAIADALKYEITDEPDSARPGAKPPIPSTSVSPVGQGDPGQEEGAEWTEYEEGYHDGAMAERKDWQEGGPGSTFLGDRAAAAADVRSQGPLLTEEDWQSFPTDPETRDTVLDYLAERGYLAVRDDDSEATR